MLCAKRGDEPHACECPPNGTAEFSADPSGTRLGEPPYPTGVAGPPQCRFRRLGDALAAAAAHGGPATVQVYGASGAPVVFGGSTGESWPLDVPEGVTLVGAAAPAGETSILGDGASAASILRVAGIVERVRIENVSMTGTGVELSCGASGTPTLRDVIVSAGTPELAKGVTIANTCGALLERMDVSGASGAALDIAVPATASVTAKGSLFHASGVGVQARGGILRFEQDGIIRTEVTDNAGNGIELRDTTAVDATLADVLVARNGGTGIFVNMIPTDSKLTMTSCDVHSNGTATPIAYGPSGNRNAGGMLLTQSSLATFQLLDNRFHANDGGTGADELAFESTGTWTLSTGTCATANAFGCVGTGAAVSIIPLGTVNARFTTWPEIAPPVNGTVIWSPDYCDSSNAPACP